MTKRSDTTSKLRVLVLGSGGYVGKHLVAALHASGWAEPIPAGRRPGSVAEGGMVFDATDAAALARAVDGMDAVINAVAGSHQTMVAGAQALRTVLSQRSQPIRLVHFSSMAVYGAAIGRVDENTPLADGLQGYADAKVQAERVLAGLDEVVVFRPGCIYGPGSPQWSVRIARLLQARRIGDLGAAGDGYSNLVYLEDVGQAVLAALHPFNDRVSRTYNLAMPDAPTWNTYFEVYARLLGAVPVQRISARRLAWESRVRAPVLAALRIAARGRQAEIPPPIPPSLLRLWAQDIRLDVSAATADLDIRWHPLRAGVSAAVAAHRT